MGSMADTRMCPLRIYAENFRMPVCSNSMIGVQVQWATEHSLVEVCRVHESRIRLLYMVILTLPGFCLDVYDDNFIATRFGNF